MNRPFAEWGNIFSIHIHSITGYIMKFYSSVITRLKQKQCKDLSRYFSEEDMQIPNDVL